MCCEPQGGEGPVKDQCPDCGENRDQYGDAYEICGHSETDCETCGSAPCSQYC